MNPAAPAPPAAKRLGAVEWLICAIATIGFAFDIYELLMLPLIVKPALATLGGVGANGLPLLMPGTPEFTQWARTLFFVPAIFGGIFGLLGGWLTDLLGRRRVLTGSILLYALAAFAAGFATTLPQLLFWRCLVFIGVCVEFVAAVAWLAELFPNPKQRERVLGFTQAASSIGGLLVAVANGLCVKWAVELPAIHGGHEAWRYTLISGLIPAIPLLLIRPFLPESPVWQKKKMMGQLRRPSLAELFSPELRRATLVSAVVFASCYGMAFGAIQHLPQIIPGMGDVKVQIKARQDAMVKQAADEGKPAPTPKLLMVAGKKIEEERAAEVQKWQEVGGLCGRIALALLVVFVVSRRTLLRIFHLPAMIYVPLFFWWLSSNLGGEGNLSVVKWGAFGAGFLVVATFSFWGNYLPLVYPVHLRGTGEGFVANIGGRILGTAAAWFTFTFSAALPPSPGRIALTAAIVAGVFALVGALLTHWLPEPGKDKGTEDSRMASRHPEMETTRRCDGGSRLLILNSHVTISSLALAAFLALTATGFAQAPPVPAVPPVTPPPAAPPAAPAPEKSAAPQGTPLFLATLKQAEADDAAAQFQVGMLFAGGKETAQNATNAVAWLRKSAALGNLAAQFNLAVFLSQGVGAAADYPEAAQWFRKAADAGDRAARYNLAVLYMNGAGVKQDPAEAAKLFRLAAEQGDVSSQMSLALMLANGQGVTADLPEAYVWLTAAMRQENGLAEAQRDELLARMTPTQAFDGRRRCAARGDKEDQFSVGVALANGEGVKSNLVEAVSWFTRAATNGHPEAQLKLAMAYADGQGVVANQASAARWFRSAAEQGHIKAQYQLGTAYADGRGVARDDIEALKWLRKSAGQGVAPAQARLGWMLARGLGGPTNFVEAAQWFRKAADQDEPSGSAGLGLLLERGQGVKADLVEAAKFYRAAAARGNVEAQLRLGYCLADGRGVNKDAAEAANWFRKAAEAGDARAQSSLGFAYTGGNGVPKDYAEAVRWFRHAADQGDAQAQFNLGVMSESGLGVKADAASAAHWYRKAAEQGLADAQVRLATLCAQGRGMPPNDAEAAKWFRQAADRGDTTAQLNLGILYEQGRGVPKEAAQSRAWYRKAADQGDARAMYRLGLGNTQGSAPNYEEALKWFHKAADKGDALSQYNLGVLYDTGRGVSQNFAEAAKWYRLAAESGHPLAQLNLANLHDAGQGVPKNVAEAVRWYRKAAAQQEPQAELALGLCYADGDGVTADPSEAYKWVSLATVHGNTNAAALKPVLEKKLNPEQMTRAQQAVAAALAGSGKK